MKRENIRRVLVAPLDWGLGHTTRCIPIVKELLKNGTEVFLAGNDVQTTIFEKEFPMCKRLHLQGYNVSYARKKSGLLKKLLWQLPKIHKAIQYEHEWLAQVVEEFGIDIVISDNRYGLYHDRVHTVFITHQLHIKAPFAAAEKLLRRFNYTYINRFNECWIPDYKDEPDLSGELGHPEKMPGINCSYIGPLSRMQAIAIPKTVGHLLCILSGPEPQRTILETALLSQLENYKGTATVLRGLPAGGAHVTAGAHVTVYSHIDTKTFNDEMCRAEYIICRSGYSSVMDIHAVGAHAILIPTPGQTEQEYLANYLESRGFAVSGSQAHPDLHTLLQKAAAFAYRRLPVTGGQLLKTAVQQLP